ncbi:MAG: hypothetical protein WC494_03760 [Candidatus Pacearchaeota archaeon]
MDNEQINVIANKIAQYRGVIIHDSISIEAMLGAIIAIYFVKDNKNNEFNRKVIDDEYFSFGLKIRVLEKLNFEVYSQFFEDIRRMNNIRNIFAHHVPTLDEGFIQQNSKDGKVETKYMSDLHKEFLEKIKKVDEQLHKIFFKVIEENKKEKEK